MCPLINITTRELKVFTFFFPTTSTDQTVLWHHAMLNRSSNLQDRRGSESERDLAVLEENFEGYVVSEGVCFQRLLFAKSSGMFFLTSSPDLSELKSFQRPPKLSEGLDGITIILSLCWVLRFQSKHNMTTFKPSIFFHYLHRTHIRPVCLVISSKLC